MYCGRGGFGLHTYYTSKLWPEKSIISAFKEAGYVTYYISYLSNVHSGDNAINQIVNEADYYIRRPDEEGDYDMLGVPIIHNILDKDKAEKKLIIYKLVGSHYNFHDRYPENYAVFQPAFTKDNFNGPNPNQKDMFINTYDNSILYTNTVISDIIKLLKKESGDVSMSFISDHGVSIYEDGKTLYLNSKQANYNIACFFWMNNKAKERIGNLRINKLKNNINMPIDQTYFIDTVFDISGVSSEKKRGKSLFYNVSNNDNRAVFKGNKLLRYCELK